ncbi:helix-turn-helix domain-containing protein [Variovorax sp. Sphag1AA]|uniref:helix-turn-helix domain-containing protein n=1 Tax=Variovorax sp. Sphag1AA TaxID=2587027 RepID=UPI0016222A9F|nr:AraC family transcriptional regulator [Variovorax sp. Sphag1AA]MBB3181346.1 AraC family transcriptional regulator [Variovorax sp. Sphag1AA]
MRKKSPAHPSELLKYLPCDVWLDGVEPGWDDVALRGVSCDPTSVYMHLRNHTVIAYVDGTPRVTRRFGGREIAARVAPGELAFKDCGTGSEWSWDRPSSAIQVYLSPHLMDRVVADIHGPNAGPWRLRDCVQARDDEVLGLVHSIAREATARDAGASLMMKSLALQLAVRLVRRHAEPAPQTPARTGFDMARRRKITSFIASNLAHPLPVAMLASQENLSVDRFTRLFRDTFDCSPHQHVLKLRLQRARELLEQPSRSVAEIAWETGFADQSHLTRSFKRHFGEPPSQWRCQQAAREHQARL